jgi:predicted secreted protein
MNIVTGFVVYIVIWWLVLFMVLPIGVKSHDETGEAVVPGTTSSAPVAPRMGLKALITSVIAAVLWLAYFLVLKFDLFALRDLAG